MKESIVSLDKEIDESVNFMSDTVWEGAKEYILPNLFCILIVLGTFYHFLPPILHKVSPLIESYLNTGNNYEWQKKPEEKKKYGETGNLVLNLPQNSINLEKKIEDYERIMTTQLLSDIGVSYVPKKREK